MSAPFDWKDFGHLPPILRACCCPPSGRFDLRAPFRHNGFVWATDGRIMVRVPDTGQALPPEPETRLPAVAVAWNTGGIVAGPRLPRPAFLPMWLENVEMTGTELDLCESCAPKLRNLCEDCELKLDLAGDKCDSVDTFVPRLIRWLRSGKPVAVVQEWYARIVFDSGAELYAGDQAFKVLTFKGDGFEGRLMPKLGVASDAPHVLDVEVGT